MMNIPKNDREFRAVLGLDNQRFVKLLALFKRGYENYYNEDIKSRIDKSPNSHNIKFKTYQDLLFFVLIELKSGITFDFLGYLFQIDHSNAKRNFKNSLLILHHSLKLENYLPFREFEDVEQFDYYFEQINEIIIDGLEQRIQRPVDKVRQSDDYSGKKKAHTSKCLIISDLKEYIHFLSYAYVGKTSEISIVREEFPVEQKWFHNMKVRLDLAYLSFDKDYPHAVVLLPHKKKPKQELTDTQKLENTALAKERISVEHSIGGMKRYDILSGQSRIHDIDIYNTLLATCAGLWNFYITN